jgi:phosphoesterase RecJ-like protein
MHNPLPVPQELIDAFNSFDEFVIIGHEHPDSDSIHSQMSTGKLLSQLGKKTHLVSAGPFTRGEIISYKESFERHLSSDLDPANTLVVIVDCSSPDRIGYLSDEIAGFSVAVIDHHASGDSSFGDIRYIDPKAFSVTFMIHHLFKTMGLHIDEDTAHMLLFGMATDTGYFRHIGPYRGEIFKAAAQLIELGASPRDIHAGMFGQKSFASRKLLGLLLSRMEEAFDGRLLYTWESAEEMEYYGELNRDSETLYAQMLSIYDCEVILYIRENTDDRTTCTVGFRSHADSHIDVGEIAAEFGGGGHRKAAGATISASIEQIIKMMQERFSREFPAS